LHSLLNLPHHVEIDAVLRAVDELPGPGVPAYVTADLRVSWRPRPNLELSIIGRDLFDGHVEFPANDYFQSNGRVVTERTVFGRLRWEF
jgi:iron complex outermembrane receptor protein